MAATPSAPAKSEMIDLTKLSPEQLIQIKQEFEQVRSACGCVMSQVCSRRGFLEEGRPNWHMLLKSLHFCDP